MSRFYITGGQQRKGAWNEDEWFSYAEARILLLDAADATVKPVATYISPEANRPADPRSNIVFKAGTIAQDKLHVCTQTEILSYDLEDFSLSSLVSHPWFNDLHHVTMNAQGNFLVACTGLDLVLEMSPAGEVIRELPVLEEDIWQRFDRDTDYRRVLTTKPHRAHPNYIFEYEGEIWATRLNQKDAVCLTDGSRSIQPMIEKVHDGNIDQDGIWFTTVDGHVVTADLASGRTTAVYDLSAMSPSGRTLGWCRGLHLLGGDKVLVGFSRLRPSKFKENVNWVKHRIGLQDTAGHMPTRVACYDLAAGSLAWEVDLEPHGLNAVFSILPAD